MSDDDLGLKDWLEREINDKDSDVYRILSGVSDRIDAKILRDEARGSEAVATTHVRIETLGCGELTVPVDHITLHMVGGTHRLLVRDDVEWREVSPATYNYIEALLDTHSRGLSSPSKP
jgi:hypothetical protein